MPLPYSTRPGETEQTHPNSSSCLEGRGGGARAQTRPQTGWEHTATQPLRGKATRGRHRRLSEPGPPRPSVPPPGGSQGESAAPGLCRDRRQGPQAASQVRSRRKVAGRPPGPGTSQANSLPHRPLMGPELPASLFSFERDLPGDRGLQTVFLGQASRPPRRSQAKKTGRAEGQL